jgi:hypothetical protein
MLLDSQGYAILLLAATETFLKSGAVSSGASNQITSEIPSQAKRLRIGMLIYWDLGGFCR